MVPALISFPFLLLGVATCHSLSGDSCKDGKCHVVADIPVLDSFYSLLQVSKKAIQSQKIAALGKGETIRGLPDAEPGVAEEKLRNAKLAEEAPSISDVPKFVISTAKYGKRTLPFVEEVQKYGDAFKNMCRVQAVVASQCSLFWHGALELGAASVSTSHMKIWQHMIYNHIPVAVIIEDDAFGLTAPNFIPLLQRALDRYRSYDLFRLSQIPVPKREALQQEVNATILQHPQENLFCRYKYGTQFYIMTLAGAKFALANFQFGSSRLSLDVYHNASNSSVYSNIDAFKIECFDHGIMRFMDDTFGDWLVSKKNNGANSEKRHPDIIAENDTTSSADHHLIDEVLPDCPEGGILMEKCANYMSGAWTVSRVLQAEQSIENTAMENDTNEIHMTPSQKADGNNSAGKLAERSAKKAAPKDIKNEAQENPAHAVDEKRSTQKIVEESDQKATQLEKLLLMVPVGSNPESMDLLMHNVEHLRAQYIGHIDVFVMHYKKADPSWMTRHSSWYSKNVQFHSHFPGIKFPLVSKAIANFQQIKNYSWIWIMDDDIDITQTDVPNLLVLAKESGSPVVGPALRSSPGVKILSPVGRNQVSLGQQSENLKLSTDYDYYRCQPGGIDEWLCRFQTASPGCRFSYTNFVEVMAPLFRPLALWQILHECNGCFSDNSVWGLDYIWCSFSARAYGLPRERGCALIDQAAVIHNNAKTMPKYGPEADQIRKFNREQKATVQKLHGADFARISGATNDLSWKPICVT